MIAPDELAEAFNRNVMIIKMQTAGLSQEDSLLPLPFRGNRLNWVVGHLGQHRDQILELLGEAPLLGERGAPYARESAPLTEATPGVLQLGELIGLLEQGQELIAAALARISPAELEREIIPYARPTTVAKHLFFLYFHETWHAGQTEYLRQLAGTDDKII
ncbi:MAG TPA: DinB family protein [Herpetosiphonaceae bacterium]